MSRLSMRQIRYQRSQAQTKLQQLLRVMRPFNPLDTATHFSEEFRKIRGIVLHAGEFQIPETPGRIRRPDDEITKFNEAVFRMLVASAQGRPAGKEDLSTLAEALHGQTMGIRYNPEIPRYEVKYDLLDYQRHASQLLLDYLNLTLQCGPLHKLCEIESCRHLMAGGRGAKRFCSAECRRTFWSYQRQKNYYQQKLAATRHSPGAAAIRKRKRQQKNLRKGT